MTERRSGIYTASVRHVKLGELANKQIEAAVVVIVEPSGMRTPTARRNASLICDIRESPVPIIAIENVAAALRYIDIGKAVSVVISHGDAHAIASARPPPSFRCDISESAVAVVAIKRILQRMRRVCKSLLLPLFTR